ncbi:MspA family porin [Nocardia sp. NPDC059239]|uniref:MspA family porin n=1 Tax=Nocardia sp. NPDC059239 TaxID=3346785 RepID=UPI003698AC57
MTIPHLTARAASTGAAAVAATALTLFTTAPATADTVVPLPGADLTKTLSDGTTVHIWLDGESANINPSMGATPLHRNAWVSGTGHVDITAGNTASTTGLIYPGYVVGCQVAINGGGVNGGPTAGVTVGSNGSVTPSLSGNAGANLSLGPGQAQSFYILDREKPDGFGADSHKTYNSFTSGSGSVAWADETIGLNGCAGYAQARAFVSVEIDTDTITSWVTIWGQPFSIG